MFRNIGQTIKTLASILLWIGIACSVVIGVFLLANDNLAGPLCIIIGGFLSILSASLIYGFGQLVENSDYIVECRRNEINRSHKKQFETK